jgi:error-prone DNA polymerase
MYIMYRIHDILCCIRTGIQIDSPNPMRPLNGEAYLKSREEMEHLWSQYPEGINTMERIANECTQGIVFEKNLFPEYSVPCGCNSRDVLKGLVFEGANQRYQKITNSIVDRLDYELRIISKLGLQDYFLVVWDIVQEAKSRGIRYAGRGSAADSAVAYCLGITQVDSIKRGLLFERFLSLERSQKPDIDIDFEGGSRDEVIQYVIHKYGGKDLDCVAGVCTFSTYRARSALRDVGLVLGFSQDELGKLAKKFPHVAADNMFEAICRYPELKKSGISFERYSQLFEICEGLASIPRFSGTHLGGIVISREPLTCVTPLLMGASNRMITQFDKRWIEELGLVKLDFLSLRTLSAINDCVKQIQCHCEEGSTRYCSSADMSDFDYDSIPLDDQGVYSMLQSGETIGVFQLESPAQRALQTRLGSDRFEDIVASVALIRPGPIEGNMVEPFIACRIGEQSPSYLHLSLDKILKKTYGVVLYQEQVIQIATEIAGFTPGESDKLRKVMTHARSRVDMDEIGHVFIQRAIARGVSPDVAEQVFSCIRGYAGYGFCEAHAAAFADTAYKTAYLVRYYPEYFYAALLNNQPMGFYSPSTLCIEARRRGIKIYPVDVNTSRAEFTARKGCIRIGLKQVKGMSDTGIQSILSARDKGLFASIFDFCKRVSIDRDILKNLVLCGAFDSLHRNRREVLWHLPAAIFSSKQKGSLLQDCEVFSSDREVEDFTDFEKVKYEYLILGLSHEHHIMDYIKDLLPKGTMSTSQGDSFPQPCQLRNQETRLYIAQH